MLDCVMQSIFPTPAASKLHPDQRYIIGLMEGNPIILDEIYAKYSQAVLTLVKKNNGTVEDARDVMQDSLLIVLRKAKQGQLQLSSSFITYFYSVCRHVWWKVLKKRKRSVQTEIENVEIVDETDVMESIEQQERYKLYLKHFNVLSSSAQQILQLHLAGKSIKEITNIMGFNSESYTRKRKSICKAKLLKNIKADPYYQELV